MDRDLVIAAQGGDREAFAVPARTQVDRLYAIANRMLRDTALAEDAAQQSLVTIWRELPSLRDPERFDGWATRILVNQCNTEARRRTRLAGALRASRPTAPRAATRSSPSSIATSSNVASDACRPTSGPTPSGTCG